MRRRLMILALLALCVLCLPSPTAGRLIVDEGGFDPCTACIYIPAWCGMCLIEQWWDQDGDCFPWWPECD